MIQITNEIADKLAELSLVGHFSEFGAVIGDDCQFIIYYKDDNNNNNPYLAHISEFEWKGILVRLKEK